MISLTVLAPPGWCAINRRTADSSFRLSERYLAFREAVVQEVELAREQGRIPVERPAWRAVGIAVSAYWPTQHRKDPELAGLPRGDIDSPLKGVLDALEHAGVYKDDTQIIELVALKAVDHINPRVVIELWEVVS